MPQHDRMRYRAPKKWEMEKRASDRKGWIIIGTLGVALIALAISWQLFLKTPPINSRTGCLVDRKLPEAHTVVLIDETDALSGSDLKFVKAVIENEYYWLPLYGRLTVRNIIANPDAAEDIVVCRMSDGSDSLGIASTPRKIRRDFEKTVGVKLAELYDKLEKAPIQNQSPIVESIDQVFHRTNFTSQVKQRRLVLVSDMAQHSTLFTQYSRSKSRAAFDTVAEFRPTMSQAEVRIHYIKRRALSRIQTPAHRLFWNKYFADAGASVVINESHDLHMGEDVKKQVLVDDEADS